MRRVCALPYQRLDPLRPAVHVRSTEDENLHEAKLGPNVLAGIKDVKEHLKWLSATVIRNDAVSLDGGTRLLHLSVPDHVDLLYGKKIQGRADRTRFIDSYTVPGQFVALRCAGSNVSLESPTDFSRNLYSIACSPYESRRDSSYLDASIIEVSFDRTTSEETGSLGCLSPGDTVEVSQVIGRGFSSLFNSYMGLNSALEESRNLLIIAVGTRGLVPARAVLNWAPVQAHATAHHVTCYYLSTSPQGAAFISEWDVWREAGVRFQPLYCGEGNGTNGGVGQEEEVLARLEAALFEVEGGLVTVLGGNPSGSTVLLSGLTGSQASRLSKALTQRGLEHEQLLFNDFF